MASEGSIRLHLLGRLVVFLPTSKRSGQLALSFRDRPAVKHLLEAHGVPHTEVGQLRAGGERIDFSYLPQDGDLIEVFPASPGLDELSGLHRDGRLTIEPRFLLDNHLGRLAALLRMLGFDCLYRNDYQDEYLAQIAASGERILLSRDRRLLMRKIVRYGYCLRSLAPGEQITEVLERFALAEHIHPFHRCLRCNTPLQAVEKSEILEKLKPLTQLYYDEFHRCPACGQVYWKGSHYERMVARLEQLLPGPI
ncbi:MAG TPA: Mut7-C RNAse domain-containing protein [Anaerolineales bacterium]|nr:Mut7-C RNAse domain-containing protein [Anaerolineales bacterium]